MEKPPLGQDGPGRMAKAHLVGIDRAVDISPGGRGLRARFADRHRLTRNAAHDTLFGVLLVTFQLALILLIEWSKQRDAANRSRLNFGESRKEDSGCPNCKSRR